MDLTDDDNIVPILQIGDLDFDPNIAVTAEVDMLLDASINDDPGLPSFTTELFVFWQFDQNGGQQPIVEFNNMTLDVASSSPG